MVVPHLPAVGLVQLQGIIYGHIGILRLRYPHQLLHCRRLRVGVEGGHIADHLAVGDGENTVLPRDAGRLGRGLGPVLRLPADGQAEGVALPLTGEHLHTEGFGGEIEHIIAVVLLQIVPRPCMGQVLEAEARVLPQVCLQVGGVDPDNPVLPRLAEGLGVDVTLPVVVSGEEGAVGGTALGVGELVV